MVNINKMMKQAQKMQADMMKMQEEIAQQEFEGSAGGGMVKAKVMGDQRLVELKIDPEVVDPEDVEMLEDMVVAAVSSAMEEAQKASASSMESLTGGMGMPSIPGLGF